MKLEGLNVTNIVFKDVTIINAENRDSILADAEASGCKAYYDEDDCSFSCEGKCSGAGKVCQMIFDADEATGILKITCGCE